MLYEFDKEQRLRIHVIERRLSELSGGDVAAARTLAEYAIQCTSKVLFKFRMGSISGGDFCVVYSNQGRDNDWLRGTFRDCISADCQILAEVGCNYGEKVIHMPQLDDVAATYSFLFLLVGDGSSLEDDLRELWVRGH
ncbi:hypothetical protein LOC68_09565 [Blastopirellula sp. JC732]|uniref:Uncharacterized protein n=1 Tax=Blastopirellula sediminis TaxID=2894196 RepID=A0A9X1SF32_9BACT|nr:hypothetical protein [Blastopirellula sediminis]MCC9608578.1 hypothetical protein [Blastopirellula sediminis]MCC9628645.1 hypothetical protein [Blastopirellula sediminis]